MPRGDKNFPFDDDDDYEFNPEAEKLRQQIEEVYKKCTGENTEPVTNDEILQFLRVINYNFISLTRLLQAILLKSVEMDTVLMNLELSAARQNARLQQFFEVNSMLEDITEKGLDVSGSAFNTNFIF